MGDTEKKFIQLDSVSEQHDAIAMSLSESLSRISKIMEPIYEQQLRLVSELRMPMIKFQESFSKIAKPLHDQQWAISQSLTLFAERMNAVSEIHRESLNNVIENYRSLAVVFQDVLDKSQDDTQDYDDYVQVPNDTFESMQQVVEVPESVYIPCAGKTIKIKTEFFIGIVFNIVTLIITVFGCIQAQSSQTDTLLEQQNELLSDILDSVDFSNSVQADSLEELRESVHSNQQYLQSIQESLDSVLESEDNKNE